MQAFLDIPTSEHSPLSGELFMNCQEQKASGNEISTEQSAGEPESFLT